MHATTITLTEEERRIVDIFRTLDAKDQRRAELAMKSLRAVAEDAKRDPFGFGR